MHHPNPMFAGDHYSEIVAWRAKNQETGLEDGRMRGRDKLNTVEHGPDRGRTVISCSLSSQI